MDAENKEEDLMMKKKHSCNNRNRLDALKGTINVDKGEVDEIELIFSKEKAHFVAISPYSTDQEDVIEDEDSSIDNKTRLSLTKEKVTKNEKKDSYKNNILETQPSLIEEKPIKNQPPSCVEKSGDSAVYNYSHVGSSPHKSAFCRNEIAPLLKLQSLKENVAEDEDSTLDYKMRLYLTKEKIANNEKNYSYKNSIIFETQLSLIEETPIKNQSSGCCIEKAGNCAICNYSYVESLLHSSAFRGNEISPLSKLQSLLRNLAKDENCTSDVISKISSISEFLILWPNFIEKNAEFPVCKSNYIDTSLIKEKINKDQKKYFYNNSIILETVDEIIGKFEADEIEFILNEDKTLEPPFTVIPLYLKNQGDIVEDEDSISDFKTQQSLTDQSSGCIVKACDCAICNYSHVESSPYSFAFRGNEISPLHKLQNLMENVVEDEDSTLDYKTRLYLTKEKVPKNEKKYSYKKSFILEKQPSSTEETPINNQSSYCIGKAGDCAVCSCSHDVESSPYSSAFRGNEISPLHKLQNLMENVVEDEDNILDYKTRLYLTKEKVTKNEKIYSYKKSFILEKQPSLTEETPIKNQSSYCIKKAGDCAVGNYSHVGSSPHSFDFRKNKTSPLSKLQSLAENEDSLLHFKKQPFLIKTQSSGCIENAGDSAICNCNNLEKSSHSSAFRRNKVSPSPNLQSLVENLVIDENCSSDVKPKPSSIRELRISPCPDFIENDVEFPISKSNHIDTSPYNSAFHVKDTQHRCIEKASECTVCSSNYINVSPRNSTCLENGVSSSRPSCIATEYSVSDNNYIESNYVPISGNGSPISFQFRLFTRAFWTNMAAFSLGLYYGFFYSYTNTSLFDCVCCVMYLTLYLMFF